MQSIGGVIRLSHEVPETVAQWPSLPQFLADALSDALVEGVCDMAEADVGESLKLGNRFSPGYGDLPLSVGRDIVSNTRSDILLGIRFTDSGLALPKKTVTAIIPVYD